MDFGFIRQEKNEIDKKYNPQYAVQVNWAKRELANLYIEKQSAIDSLKLKHTANKKKIREEKDEENKKLLGEVQVIKQQIIKTEEEHKILIKKFFQDVHEDLDQYFTLPDYKIGENTFENYMIPETICIGYHAQKTPKLSVLSELYGRLQPNIYDRITLNLLKSGNIIIKANLQSLDDEILYKTICGITLKFLESFPLGSLAVTIIDTLNHASFAIAANPSITKGGI